jgi:hypothetical protein
MRYFIFINHLPKTPGIWISKELLQIIQKLRGKRP